MQLAAAVAEAAAPKRPHEAMVPMAEHKRLVGLRLERAREEGAAAEKALKRHLRAQHDEAIASLRSDTQRAIANASAAARSVAAGEHESELRSLAARLERAHADATQSGEAAQRSQHSLYVVRAHWGGLRTALAHLHASLTSNGGSGGGGKRLASSQLLAHLMAEWDPTSKGALESAVECSMASGKALLEAATEAWVGAQRDTGSLRAQVDDARSGRDALSAAGARAQTELRTHLAAAADATEAAAERAAEAQAEAAGSRVREEAARAEARRHADARSVAEGQVGALKARLAEASAEVDVLRARLDEAAGSTVSAGAALAAREQAMRKGDYELQDLLATVALLHQRIEFMSADAASSVDALKSKLSSILAPVRVPDLLGDAAMAAAAGGGGPAAMAVTAAAAAAAAHAASGPSARAAHAHLELRSLLQHELMSAEGRGSDL
ncbi:hypothetical protein FOA52_006418 [Chlamydomonas sp. UWO 241]|nr:hypothetical protein FOA52_006418 [Chlamydomonas sp. UWO 241]